MYSTRSWLSCLNVFRYVATLSLPSLREENRILRSRLKQQRVVLSPEERGRLLAIGTRLNHRVKGLVTIVQYRTYQRWLREREQHRTMVRAGRPRKFGLDVREAIVRIAKENPGWGYLRIVGELRKLRCKIGKMSVRRILREEGHHLRPSPPSHVIGHKDFQPWGLFVKAHLNTLVACDFFSKDIWTPFGNRQAYVLVFLHVGSRKTWISPSTYHPNASWVQQQGREMLMWLEDLGVSATHLIRDRDTKFTAAFDCLMQSAGIQAIKTPVCAPNANAFAESWIATVRRECLDHFLCFSRRHLDYILWEYVGFYNELRPHQGMGNRPLRMPTATGSECRTLASAHCVSGGVQPSSIWAGSQLGGFGSSTIARAWSLNLFMMVFQGCAKEVGQPCHGNTYGREQNDVQASLCYPSLGSLACKICFGTSILSGCELAC